MNGWYLGANLTLLGAWLIVLGLEIERRDPAAVAGSVFVMALLGWSTLHAARVYRGEPLALVVPRIDDPPDADDGDAPAPLTADEIAMKERMLVLLAAKMAQKGTRGD